MSDRPTASTPQVAGRMSRQARRDTTPELAVRRLMHARGLRYRVDHPLPGMPRRRADLVFPRARVAVFVDGCFWHSCPVHATSPAANAVWWREKLARNVARDRETDTLLVELGWLVLRFWEHEDPASVADQVVAAVAERGAGAARSCSDGVDLPQDALVEP